MSTRSIAVPIPADIRPAPAAESAAPSLSSDYSLRARLTWTLLGILAGVVIAGFWNFRAVDGFGRDVVAGSTIGDTSELAGSFAVNGAAFGLVFGMIVGMAATFTACNCVVYAMLPSLACTTDNVSSTRNALKSLGLFAAGVVGVGVLYGLYVGGLGLEGAQAYNARDVRLPQAQWTFTLLGALMLVWAAVDWGYLGFIVKRLPESWRAVLRTPQAKASIMGVLVGLFAVGRPFPPFRDFLTYAAAANNPLYGGLVMGLHGLGQIALMVVLFLSMVTLLRGPLTRWVTSKPHQPPLVSALALTVGGAYFIYYWGLALALDIGRWGFKLGLYQ